MKTTLLPPQFMVYFQDGTPGFWSPGIINYNGSPYMLVGDSLEEVLVSWKEENNIDPLPADQFRVVNTYYNTLYQLNDDQSGFIEIEHSDSLEGADKTWFDR